MHVCSNQQCCRSALEEHMLSAHWTGGSTATLNYSLPEIAGGDKLFVTIDLELMFLMCILQRWALLSGSMAWPCSGGSTCSASLWLGWVHWHCSKAAQAQLPTNFRLEGHRWPVACCRLCGMCTATWLAFPSTFSTHRNFCLWCPTCDFPFSLSSSFLSSTLNR